MSLVSIKILRLNIECGVVTFIDRIGNSRYFGGITNNCNVWSTVTQAVYQAGTGMLSQSADHGSTRDQNLFSSVSFTQNSLICYGKSLAAGMDCHILIHFF